MLEVSGLVSGYGRISILRDVELRVEPGELVALVGVNGAGKTTLMKTIAGLVPASAGRIAFQGSNLTGRGAERAVDAGIVLVPEGRMVFPRMTVWENLMLGGVHPRPRPHREATLRHVFELFPRLAERRDQKAATMSGGEQQMLAIGRGLMAQPKLLILDEPSLGLSPLMVQETYGALRRLNAEGLTILLAEQNVKLSLALSRRGYVMENGRIVLTGASGDLVNDPATRKAYLGR
ncbi:ABC transporter ATP-binding protein [uncultured Bradyrhizobium sp.]|uniref:ABC transporter ATP-binding protein n=1 Tax=uncultured Bradyrhizobium sp. TaxID=199684 RepID=UPI0026239BA4|nr:ABC transporter ATP-binding protein [uncultured Bradyrhizobium sp.]